MQWVVRDGILEHSGESPLSGGIACECREGSMGVDDATRCRHQVARWREGAARSQSNLRLELESVDLTRLFLTWTPFDNFSDMTQIPSIQLRGAKMHNLQDIDVDIPGGQFVVLTGPSGSGKSTLAFDTLFAEGQRQYIESLSAHARQFMHQMERPELESADHLPPTIAIEQHGGGNSPRNTVATATEIYDYLRILMARLGVAHCPECGMAVQRQDPEDILDFLLELPDGTRLIICAPMVRDTLGAHAEVFQTIRRAGFVRVRLDGQYVDLEHLPKLDPHQSHSIEAVIDRLIVRHLPAARPRFAESLRLALKHGNGLVLASYEVPVNGSSAKSSDVEIGGKLPMKWKDRLFSTEYSCPKCHTGFEELEPRHFSFTSPYGVCPACEGLGVQIRFDPELLVPNPELPIQTAIVVYKKFPSLAKRFVSVLRDYLAEVECDANALWSTLGEEQRRLIFYGDDLHHWPGVMALLESEYERDTTAEKRRWWDRFRDELVCSECGGSRLRAAARAVTFLGQTLHQLVQKTVSETQQYFKTLKIRPDFADIADPLISEIRKRLDCLAQLGLGYLTLERPVSTLSGGEFQRVKLVNSLGSGLVGVCYVLDEPSIGLHPRDNTRLIAAIRELQQLGNTVVVVEHDETMMRQADWLIDMGPGAGRFGGRIVDQGTPQEVTERSTSLTGQYLSGEKSIPVPTSRRRVAKTRMLTIEGAAENNLKSITVHFPLGVLTCVTGVSGSGKSSLLLKTVARAVYRKIWGFGPKPGVFTALRGASKLDKILQIDQQPIGRSPRSSPATYTGVFDEIRKVFAQTRDAKRLGWSASRFSFNVKGGRCEACQGQGTRRIEMSFLPDFFTVCPICEGRRFNRKTLEVRFHGYSIADVLEMPIERAAELFQNIPTVSRILTRLCEVGLGYLTLGQSALTLSGGESQRIKLATELARVETGNTLYILDEPTTGLHMEDVGRLISLLGKLVERGNTVIVIEHHPDVLKTADWIIDLGPEGGESGGYLVAAGTPEQMIEVPESVTGQFLRELLPSRADAVERAG